MDDLSSANLSETKRALLQKYLHGELTLNGARRINARADQDLSALRPPSPRSPLRPLSPRLSSADLPVDRPVTLMFEAKAKQLAHHLRKRGVGPETLVGLAVNRSLEMLIGALAILKAGSAYVPLDPA